MQRCVFVGKVSIAEPCEQSLVQLFHQVIANLVGLINSAFHVGEFRIGRSGRTGFIFDMPKIKIGAVVMLQQGDPLVLVRLQIR